MRNAISLTALLCLFLALPASAQAPPAPGAPSPTQGRKKRVAIMDFDYATVHGGVAALFGQDVDVGKGVSDLLVTYLVKDGSYSVIERKALDKIMAEQNFSNSDRANPTSAAKLGKLLGVDAIIVGSITQFGNDTKKTGVGGAGGGLGGFGLGGFKHSNTKAIVGLDARIVDIDTGEIPYPVFCYVGLLPWLFFAQSVQRATVSMVAERNLLGDLELSHQAPASRLHAWNVDDSSLRESAHEPTRAAAEAGQEQPYFDEVLRDDRDLFVALS